MKRFISALSFLLITSFSISQVEVQVVDVGNGLCNLIKLPDGKVVMYDAGHYNQKKIVKDRLDKMLDGKKEIELLVLSHTDADHWGFVEQLMTDYKVKRVVRNDYRCGTSFSETWLKGRSAIKKSVKENKTIDINISKGKKLANGKKFKDGHVFLNVGGAKVTFVCGFGQPKNDWGYGCNDNSKQNNAISIIFKVEYKGSSVLLTGDAVGRDDCKKDCNCNDECIATEKYMLDNSKTKKLIDADVIIAPHHGADNGSCTSFIEAVSPEYVIFSAGHAHHRHPRTSTAQRYLDYGVKLENIYRTDLGDDENGKKKFDPCKSEWDYGSIEGEKDKAGDDDVTITLNKDGSINIEQDK